MKAIRFKSGKTGLQKPRRLMPGDTIGIAAPAGPFDRKSFYDGISVLEGLGFRVHWPEDIFEKTEYLAGLDSHRAKLMNRLLSDPEIRAIVCARGGFGTMKMLSLLDVELIRQDPKIFLGFSDISALLSVIYLRCGLVTFHGPVVTTLGNATKKTIEAMHNALTSNANLEFKNKKGVVIKPGLASGPISGGNLTTLCHLVGTPFSPCFKGHILLLEDTGEAPYRIDRMLTQMNLARCFDGIRGVILGSFTHCGDLGKLFKILEDAFNPHRIPIMGGFEIGHERTNVTIPFGIKATLDTEVKTLRFHEPATVA